MTNPEITFVGPFHGKPWKNQIVLGKFKTILTSRGRKTVDRKNSFLDLERIGTEELPSVISVNSKNNGSLRQEVYQYAGTVDGMGFYTLIEQVDEEEEDYAI